MTTETASQIDKALGIEGWMSKDELIWLAARASECKRIIEFGSYLGRSTRALADNCDGTIWAVDPWIPSYKLDSGAEVVNLNTFVMPYFLRNLKDHIESKRVIPVRAFSHTFRLDCEVDMIFLDGDHRYESVLRDIGVAKLLLRDGGLLCGHDYDHSLWPGVKKAVDTVLDDIQLAGESIWWTRKF